MRHWNYRIVQTHKGGKNSDPFFQVQEVFHNDDGTIAGYSDPCFGSEYSENILNILLTMVQDIMANPEPISKKDVVGFNNPVPF